MVSADFLWKSSLLLLFHLGGVLGADSHCLCGLTSFFSPLDINSRHRNFEVFSKRIRTQGLWLMAVELVGEGDGSNELYRKESLVDDLVTVRYSSEDDIMLWQKERLLNIGLNRLKLLRETNELICQNVVWIDADLIFLDDTWIESSCEALQHNFTVIQPFQSMTRLSESETKGFHEDLSKTDANDIIRKSGVKTRSYKTPYPGLVWAARWDIISKTGFFDMAIVGGGDTLLEAAFHLPLEKLREFVLGEGRDDSGGIAAVSNVPKLANAFLNWAERNQVYNLTEGKIGVFQYSNESLKSEVCIDEKDSEVKQSGDLLHLWHGDIENRQYWQRHRIMVHGKFDPAEDIEMNEQGAWKWSNQEQNGRKKLMKRRIKRFFDMRREDG